MAGPFLAMAAVMLLVVWGPNRKVLDGGVDDLGGKEGLQGASLPVAVSLQHHSE